MCTLCMYSCFAPVEIGDNTAGMVQHYCSNSDRRFYTVQHLPENPPVCHRRQSGSSAPKTKNYRYFYIIWKDNYHCGWYNRIYLLRIIRNNNWSCRCADCSNYTVRTRCVWNKKEWFSGFITPFHSRLYFLLSVLSA